jgi:hypothetical protein
VHPLAVFVCGMFAGAVAAQLVGSRPHLHRDCAVAYPFKATLFAFADDDEKERRLKAALLGKSLPCLFAFLSWNSISGDKFREIEFTKRPGFSKRWPSRTGYVMFPTHWSEWTYPSPGISSAMVFIEHGLVVDVIVSHASKTRLQNEISADL